MRFFLRCLLGIMLVLMVGSCATTQRLGRACDNVLTVRVTPGGAETEFHPNVPAIRQSLCQSPELEQQYSRNLGSGWNDVTYDHTLEIPYDQPGIKLRLIPIGHPTEIWYRYEREGRSLNAPHWDFDIWNQGTDSDDYELVTYVKYKDGQEFKRRYRVRNHRTQ